MNKLLHIFIIGAMLAGTIPVSAAVQAVPAPEAEFLPGSVLVALAPGSSLKSNKELAELAERFGVTSATSLDPSGKSPLASAYEVRFNSDIPVAEAVAAFAAADGVVYAEPNTLFHPAVEFQNPPNDPLYTSAWHLANVNAFGGWLVSWGSPTIPIAIIDTGVKWDHPDLAANIWINSGESGPTAQQGPAPNCTTLNLPLNKNCNNLDDDLNGYVDDWHGWDFVNTFSTSCAAPLGEDCLTPDNNPSDHYGHGTVVAGAAAAVTDNGIGVAGICRTCKLMLFRAGYTVMDASGNVSGASLTAGAISGAITSAANNGARVIVMSFQGGFSTTVNNAINAAASQGRILVAAAGNGNTDNPTLAFPGYAANAIGVGATNQTDQKAYMSNYGAWVDVSAPGVGIWTTNLANSPVMGNSGDYVAIDGTSLAAPLVAGLAGLIIAKNPAITADQVRTLIQSGIDALTTSQHLGTGRINLQKALYLGISGFSPPVALLASTVDNASAAAGPVAVTGTANGTNSTYRLLVGSGVNPTTWTVFQPATPAQIVNNTLGNWNPASLGLGNGTYTLRLEVTQGQKKFIDDTLVSY